MTTADRTIYKGETALLREAVLDQDGAVKNLSSATVSFRIGNVREVEFVFIKVGSLVTDGTDGLIEVSLTVANTNSLSVRQWDYQFIVTDSGSDVQVVKQGVLEVINTLPAV